MNTAITAVSSKRAMKSDIPINFIADILSRLPVKSVLRFFCVSKPWAELIKEPGFINTHLKRSINGDRDCTIIIDQNLAIGPHFSAMIMKIACLRPWKFTRHCKVVVEKGWPPSWITAMAKRVRGYRDGKKVVLDDCKNLFWYDIEKKRSKRLENQNLPVVFTPLTSTGSLLLLDGDSLIDPKEKKRKK